MIYFDNAATTRIDDRVLHTMMPYLTENYGNTQSQHTVGRTAANALISARDKIAALLSCRSDEVYFVSGGTEAGNTALKGVCARHKSGKIVLSAIEHPSLIESAEDMKKFGFEVVYVKPDERGVILPENVEKALTDDTVFCGVMAANNETGVIQPVEEIGALCKKRGIFYYADCVQAAATMPINAGFCDGLGISSHKFYGPKGAGALYIKSGSKIDRLVSGGRQERGFRGGTVNAAAVVGMAEAYRLAAEEREATVKKLREIKEKFLNLVFSQIDGVHINGGGEVLPSHVNLSFDGCDGENLVFLLDLCKVCVSTGSACSAGAVTPSPVLTAMGLEKSRIKSAVRFSFGKYNSIEEVAAAVETLKYAVTNIRNIH